jgi:anti-sigma B factor antagonist
MKDLKANLQISKEKGAIVVKILNKRLYAAIVPDFLEKMKELLNDHNNHLIINLEEVEALDSTGLGGLVFCLKKVKGESPCKKSNKEAGNECELILCGLSTSVTTLLQLTRMDRVFPIAENVKNALNKLKLKD